MKDHDPPITGGFSNTFTYQNLSLNVFITYQAGNKIRLYPAFRGGYVDLDAMPKEFLDRWEMPGDEKVTNIRPYQTHIIATSLGRMVLFLTTIIIIQLQEWLMEVLCG